MIASTLVVLAAAALGVASPTRRAQASVFTQCKKANTAALTFDDGPYEYLYDISGKLLEKGAKGTFFFNGNNWGCIYDEANAARVKYAHDAGHQIASHTWSHPHLNDLSWDQLHDEMYRVEDAFQKIAGVKPAFVRPPYGEYNDQVREVAGMRGQSIVTWDFDGGDGVGVSADDNKAHYDQIASEHPDTILALQHEVYSSTAYDVVPHAIDVLQAAGYELVTVAECLGMDAYQSEGQPSERDDSWHC
ncbi:carbohydrate esterase family 4 protein [Schizophyllum commune H4-8]|uniref:Carbohydrate esterase family 4 protein n=1 Tax=Schizophyllum commune (strain H4-8 / FGSC 9210) TaxID=578458 RepID=D8QHK1_SCHCM|nr:carbohydrate esterase family 4 protein [Schizophyllum commune H4-8]KAI5887222.1 carbohydrate esterase family 4 protein [Schizophyllum commune H4-8]